jgi:hypothetical protein
VILIHGKCHCGNIALELEWRGDAEEIPARACGCSFCTKHGAVWTCHAGSSLAVTVRDPGLVSRYAFGTRTAAFHVCSRCGVVPLVTSEMGGQVFAVVNVNAFEELGTLRLRRAAVDFDGEETEARLARRKRSWIGDVRFVN